MASKKTSIYRANITLPGSKAHRYYYGRNKKVVEEAVLDAYPDATNVEVVKMGEFKYTIREPVVEFTPEETKQIEDYYFRKMIEFEAFKGKFNPPPAL